MIIRASSVNYTFKNPLYGYKTIIDLNMKWQKLSGKKFVPWDYGTAYTRRSCTCTLALNATEALSFIGVFQDEAKGRGINIELTPGAGFHPFGADRGDAGVFKCRMFSEEQKSSIGHPQDVFKFTCTFCFNDPAGFPAYTPPVAGIGGQKAQGVLQIGTVTNLRYPPDMQDLGIDYKVKTNLTYDGTPYGVDRSAAADRYVSTLHMIENESKTAALINYLVNTIRGTAVSIIPPTYAYMFGREYLGTGTYSCRMLNEKIEIIHNRYNEFSFPLTFWLEAVL